MSACKEYRPGSSIREVLNSGIGERGSCAPPLAAVNEGTPGDIIAYQYMFSITYHIINNNGVFY